jgi:Arc/MetJ-type ribon-helix-helix transcriptional regulator
MMSTLNVKISDERKGEIGKFLAENPYYLNKSELVHDAICRLLEHEQVRSVERRNRALATVLYDSVSKDMQEYFA